MYLTPAKHGEWFFNGNRSSVNTLLCECCTYLDPCSKEILTQEVFRHHFLFGSTSSQRAVVVRLSCGRTAALRAPQSLQDFNSTFLTFMCIKFTNYVLTNMDQVDRNSGLYHSEIDAQAEL